MSRIFRYLRAAIAATLVAGSAATLCAAAEKPIEFSANVAATDRPFTYQVTVTMDIATGWHTYDQVPDGSPTRTTKLELDLPDGVQAVNEWQRPASILSKESPQMLLFEGQAKFTRLIKASETTQPQDIDVSVSYQVCNDERCFPPAKFEETLTLPATATANEKANEKSDESSDAQFEAPVRLMVGEAPLNTEARQMYPSPNMFDVDNDGKLELVVGDISGQIYVYENSADDGEPTWEPASALETVDAKAIRVSNW